MAKTNKKYWRPSVGDRFGKMVVTADEPKRTPKNILFPCRCDCGELTYVRPRDLRNGIVISCGCGQTKHDQHKTAGYKVWKGMNQRCNSPTSKDFKYYGGRGIKVCQRWRENFAHFLTDMGPRPTHQHTIERINNDGDYEPANCCWATMKQQNRNRRKAA